MIVIMSRKITIQYNLYKKKIQTSLLHVCNNIVVIFLVFIFLAFILRNYQQVVVCRMAVLKYENMKIDHQRKNKIILIYKIK